MSRMSLATPCPAPAPSGIPFSRRLSTVSIAGCTEDDTCTADIDYTRAIQQEFRNARPRRKPTFHKKADRNAAITIFEDVIEDVELEVGQAKMLGRSTLLGKPAQRLPRQAINKDEEIAQAVQPLGEIGQARRRPDALQQESTAEAPQAMLRAAGGLKKDPRRRTIFVPTDDTTMLTIHPGANTTNRLNDTFQLFSPLRNDLPAEPDRVTETAVAAQRPTQKSRMSLAVAPKRVPLQQMAMSANNLPSADVPGQNGGKENVPPNAKMDMVEDKPVKPVKADVVEVAFQKPALARSKLYEPTAASQARQTVVVRKAVPLSHKPARLTLNRHDKPAQVIVHSKKGETGANTSPPARHLPGRKDHVSSPVDGVKQYERPTKRATPPKRTVSVLARTTKLAQYPLIAEDIAQPQLYEDSWLSHQEVALTELINEIFASAAPLQPTWQTTEKSLREQLLDTYHQPTVTTLHKRLQASLLYGALSRPKDMPSPPDPTQDIGLRKRFLNLWLQTYQEDALRAAAEVVIGRQVPRKGSSLPGSLQATESVMDPSKGKRALVGFLETFLVVVEDVDNANEEPSELQSVEGRRWRKMMLRSLMLIWLLDQAKVSGSVCGCLFRPTSGLKSSLSVLQSLSGLLTPSVGDITRALRHFDFAVTHVQDPLDEVIYRVENIAVDLRDGVFLTRLVEIMLFSTRRDVISGDDANADATMTITMPDMTVLGSALYAEDGSRIQQVLSRHLKMPCLGRAQKTHNVQLALSALAAYGDHASSAVQDVTAEDIVDGHREKTLSFLWGLVSSHGLEDLVDWEELCADTRQNRGFVSAFESKTHEHRERSLQAWAASYSECKGIELRNLTTSFADGRAYEAILNAFASFMPTPNHHSTSAVSPLNSLHSLGCSAAFIKQLTASSTIIPSRTTTVSNLAFLASRLLPLARKHNAAVRIQRAFRRRRAWTTLTRRVTLARLAHSCAAVVRTQQRLTDAATVLQIAWRAVLSSRASKMNGKVEVFQVIAKGWAVRRRMRKAATGSWLAGGTSVRAIHGW